VKYSSVKNKNGYFAVRMYKPKRERLASVRHCRMATLRALVPVVLSLAACTGIQQGALVPIVVPPSVELSGGDAQALNYSTDYIYSYEFDGPGGVRGGGATVENLKLDGRPGESGGVCCTSLPLEWQPDLKLTAHWLAYQMKDGKVVKNWYKAENVRIPQYSGQQAGTTWTFFLPGERIKIMVADGNANGHNSVALRPVDGDPYIAQGIPDEEYNRLYLDGENQ
jgi:hypothetical protein